MDPFNEPLNEIIFENRNKTYGAYVLRKEYNDSLKFGILFSYAFVATLVVLCVLMGGKEIIPPKIEVENIVEDIFTDRLIELKKPEMPDPPKEKPNVVTPPENDLPKEAADTPQEQKDEPQKPQEPQEPVAPSNGGGGEPGTGSSETGTGPATTEDPNKVVPVADVAPDMEGGVMKFLQKNLRYPSIAVENRTSGTVYLSFVVEKDGSVSDINVMKAIGDGCEEEAIRVVKKMKWNPGKTGGHPVRVKFTLPVKFVINP